jgi:hypothetical protein
MPLAATMFHALLLVACGMWQGGVSKAHLYWEHGVLLYADVAGVTARVASSVLVWFGIAC